MPAGQKEMVMMESLNAAEMVVAEHLRSLIREVPDFPIPNITFKDLNPILNNASAFDLALTLMVKPYLPRFSHGTPILNCHSFIDKVAGIEARGFVFGAPIAQRLGAGFVTIRKPGKLPYDTYKKDYTLEYGTNTLELHIDAFDPEDRVLIVDDVLATGGTLKASIDLVEQAGALVAGIAVLVNLKYVPRIEGWNPPVPVHSVLNLE